MTDLRDEIENAIETVEAPETGRPAAEAPEPVRSTEAARETRVDPESTGDSPAKGSLAAAKAGDPDPAAPDNADKKPPDQERASRQFEKAPASWKPAARERWMTLPAEVRAEVYRREQEASHVIQESAGARQLVQDYQQMESRFSNILAAEGMHLGQVLDVSMNAIARLRSSNSVERAQTVAQIINSYGVDIATLDNILAGLPAQSQQQQDFRDPRLDGLLAQAEQQRARITSQSQAQVSDEIEAFSEDPANEFFPDVRGLMADLIEVLDRQGLPLDLKGAYDRAVRIHPDTSKIIEQRQAAQSKQNLTRSTARSRAASSSVAGSPSPSGPAPTRGTLRDDLEAAMDQIAGR